MMLGAVTSRYITVGEKKKGLDSIVRIGDGWEMDGRWDFVI